MTPEQRAASIRLLVLDVDGVLTDGRLFYGPQGEAMKAFDVRDGHGIKMLLGAGIGVALLSSRRSDIVTVRAGELGIDCVLQGKSDKAAAFRELCEQWQLKAAECGYAGDDLPDLPVLQTVGFAATVADACEPVKAAAHWIAPRPGGHGAVRALAEFVLHARGTDTKQWVRG